MSAPETPPLLIVGSPADCQIAVDTLSRDATFADCEILTRFSVKLALSRLSSRKDIGVVLLLRHEGAQDDPVDLVAAIAGIQAESCPAIMVRSRTPLTAAVKDELWRLGIADRLFSQPIDADEFADSTATVMRDVLRHHSLVMASDSTGRLEHAKTLRELAGLILETLIEKGIGETGGLFCMLGGTTAPRLMIVAGSGRYAGVRCMPLQRFKDPAGRRMEELVQLTLQQKQGQITEDAATLHVQTSDDDVVCIFLVLAAPLNSWQRHILTLLTKTFSSAIGKTQAEQRLLRTQHATITIMATLAEYRDVDTGEHVARVARATTEIAQVLTERDDFTESDRNIVDQIGLASILHDIGKIAIPENILLKPGPLDPEERKVMETHAVLGSEILLRASRRSDNAELLRMAAEIARSHHERYDGTGYPEGLAGEEIPLSARIVALVDVFDALTSLRPYKKEWPLERAIEMIRSGSGSHFDPAVVDAFLLLEEKRASAGFFVWTEAMSVGDALLDLDHKRLIGIINRLWVAESGGNRQVIEFILDDLVHYTESHFRREEEMIRRCGDPGLERHREIHQGICRRLEEIRWEYFQGIRDELRGEILDFLRDWLNQHILVEDMNYRPYIARAAP